MSFEIDITEFFDPRDGFADAAVYDALPIKKTIQIIFTTVFYQGAGVETSAPAAVCMSSDVVGVAHGHKLTINDVVYSVVGIDPDDKDLTTTLTLSKP